MRQGSLANILNYSVKVGKLFGIPISLHVSLIFFLIPVLPLFRSAQAWPVLEYVVFVVISILLHELGHALMAKHFKMGGLSIMLHGFGGFATSTGYRTPRQALAIVLAGPAVTFALGFLCLGIGRAAVGGVGEPNLQLLLIYALGIMNLTMGVLNLMPSLPFDGGQALSALLSFKLGEFPAHRLVGHIGLVFSLLITAYGLLINWGFVIFFGLMGLISSYMFLAQTGGVKFGEFTAQRRRRREDAEFQSRRESQSKAYLDAVRAKEKDREERERLRKLLEDSLDDDKP